MSLYRDAAAVLTAPPTTGGSFRSRIYRSDTLTAAPAQIVALITEAAKWDVLLKEVIEHAGLLPCEPKLTPLLALLLVHDLLLSRNGIAAPASHPLRQAVERHRVRLQAEFVRARVRRHCASIDALGALVLREKASMEGAAVATRPRWARINPLRTTFAIQRQSTFAEYQVVSTLADLTGGQKQLYIDDHVPDLVALPPGADLSSAPAYREGALILQDKASCFPAYLLLGSSHDRTLSGDLLDACAAPGNKTTHLAGLLTASCAVNNRTTRPQTAIFALDASIERSHTLRKMVSWAGAETLVTILAGQDFLAVNPDDSRLQRVTRLLLDPSCSGSGIVGREDIPHLILPTVTDRPTRRRAMKQRRRGEPRTTLSPPDPAHDEDSPEASVDTDRLRKLSSLQIRIVEHALRFPAAERVTYSTCSVHVRENEFVVAQALASDISCQRRWRILRRDEQPDGLRQWERRGIRVDQAATSRPEVDLSATELDACLRCWPEDGEGTGGFFVACFIRDTGTVGQRDTPADSAESATSQSDPGHLESDPSPEEDGWEGFSD